MLTLAGLLFGLVLEGAEPPPSPVVRHFDSPTYAVQGFFYWDYDIRRRDLKLVKDMGFTHVKTKISWREIETYPYTPSVFDWHRTDAMIDDITALDLKIIARIGAQPFWAQADGGTVPLDSAPPANLATFENFCEALATRYRGRIEAYQVWNEPNLAREWGDNWHTPEIEKSPNAAEYVALLRACYLGIKRGDPGAIVISAGLAPTGTYNRSAIPDAVFTHQMYDAGAASYFDVLGVHTGGYGLPPEYPPSQAVDGHSWRTFRHVEEIRNIMVQRGDAHKQIALLEMGWTTDRVHEAYSWMAVDEQTQAEYLARAYQYAAAHWQPWIGPICTIYIANPFWTEENEEWWWAITLPGYPETLVRPAYHRLAAMLKSSLPRQSAVSSEGAVHTPVE